MCLKELNIFRSGLYHWDCRGQYRQAPSTSAQTSSNTLIFSTITNCPGEISYKMDSGRINNVSVLRLENGINVKWNIEFYQFPLDCLTFHVMQKINSVDWLSSDWSVREISIVKRSSTNDKTFPLIIELLCQLKYLSIYHEKLSNTFGWWVLAF